MMLLTGCKPESTATSDTKTTASAESAELSRAEYEIQPAVEHPNIVLVVLCSFRYSHMSCAGYDRLTTPFMDSLAAKGTLFTNAYSSSAWTKPSATSILTGLTPNVHQMTDYYSQASIRREKITPKRILSENIVTLAEALADSGYATAGWINNVQAGEFFNLTQGLQTSVTDYRLSTEDMVGLFSQWLQEQESDKPFFSLIFSRDAHRTFDPAYEYFLRFNRITDPIISRPQYPAYIQRMHHESHRIAHEAPGELSDRFKTQYEDLYDAQFAQIDDAVSKLPQVLSRFNRSDKTIVIITADHGERLFGKGMIAHGAPLGEATTHIPIILNGPGIPIGQRVDRIVRNIDIYPTIMQLTGATGPPYLQGRDLLDVDTEQESRTAFAAIESSDAVNWDEQYMVRSGDFAYYLNLVKGERLFDVKNDRLEKTNLIEDKPDVADQLSEQLKWWREQERMLREAVGEAGSRELDDATIEQLRDLGYIE